MAEDFKRGDRVEWSFRGRRVVGRVRRKLVKHASFKGRAVAATADDPRYVVRSEKTGKETTRRAGTLRRLG